MLKITQKLTLNRQIALLVIGLGIIITAPSINFQRGIAQGDHGRELTIIQETLRGAKPYKDYFWDYGPLMPYIYGAFTKLLGDGPQSVIIAKNLFVICGGLFFYLTLQLFIARSFAVAGAIWFFLFNPQFHHTYNHIMAASLFMPLMYGLCRFLIQRKAQSLILSLFALLIISLIKLNVGIMMFAAFILSLLIIVIMDKSVVTAEFRRIMTVHFPMTVIAILAVYGIFIYGVPKEKLLQCFHYSPKYTDFYGLSIVQTSLNYFKYVLFFMTLNIYRMAFSAIVMGAILCLIFNFRNLDGDSGKKRHVLAAAVILAVFSLFALHEYLLTGVFYKSYWARPFDYLLIFLCIGCAARIGARQIGIFVLVFLLALSGRSFITQLNQRSDFISQTHNQFFDFNQGRYYSANEPQWFSTVHQTVDYLRKHLKSDELFLAMPYDAFYYYLLNRPSPIWEHIIVRSQHIGNEQQEEIIRNLEDKWVNYIVMSNRINSPEVAIGHFGVTHGQVLSRYIKERFEVVQTYGEWEKPPLYMSNHGVKILKRKNPF